MLSREKSFYVFIAVFCLAGYAWLFYNLIIVRHLHGGAFTGVCLFKHVTSIPCPSCGSTQSVIFLLQGRFLDALYWNPLGFVAIAGLALVPPWVTYDFFSRRHSLHAFFLRMESMIRTRWVAITAIILILANWVWNIIKGV
jgi:hypothetical protein